MRKIFILFSIVWVLSSCTQNIDIIFLQTEVKLAQIEEVTIFENGKSIQKSNVVTKTSFDVRDNLVHHFQFDRKPGKKYQVKAIVKVPPADKSVGNIYLREL